METTVGTNALVISYPVTNAALDEIRLKYMDLKVTGFNDEEGYERCKKARLEVKKLRCDVEKQRKELKADSLEFGRKVDAEAKRITEQLLAVESHLEKQQDIIDGEKERIKAEEKARIDKEIKRRIDELQKCNARYEYYAVLAMKQEEFDLFLAGHQEAFRLEVEKRQAEQARLAKMEKLRAEQEAVLRAKQAEIDSQIRIAAQAKAEAEAAERKAKAEQEARIRAEQEAERVRQEAVRAAEMRELARIKAEQDAKSRALALEQDLRRKAQEAKEEQERLEALRIDTLGKVKATFPTIDQAQAEIVRLYLTNGIRI